MVPETVRENYAALPHKAGECVACGACVDACPKGVLAIGTEINGQGYNYIERAHPEKCVLCSICGVVCPDVAVGVVEE